MKVLALVLTAIGLGVCAYKVQRLGLPLTPGSQAQVWTVEARVTFNGTGRAAKLGLLIPESPPGFSVLDEDFVSSGFGVTTEDEGVNRRALWAARHVRGRQTVYYRTVLARNRDANDRRTEPEPEYPTVPDYPEPERSAVFALLEDVRSQSADTVSFVRELLKRFNDPTPEENVSVLREDSDSDAERVRRLQYILAGARIPTRQVQVLDLVDGTRSGKLHPWLEVYNGEQWLAFDPRTGHRGFPEDMLVWHVGDAPLATIEGGRGASTEFAVARSSREVIGVAQQRARLLDSNILEFSLLSLPVSTQNIYRILLLVPLGAFAVVILRNVVGVTTFGTFMPILIALAFRETKLLWGIVLFTTLVALGVLLRFYLERLKLLLVPRLASVLIIVILLMAVVSVFSHKLGLERGLSVALFPMVILAMTIERMSVSWDESGPREALTAGIGSLVVAIIGYLVMTHPLPAYLVFVFPELLLVLLAATLLMGRYTGYRLSELRRFRSSTTSGEQP
ncbi:hypothetical protein PC39_01665 [Salinisphaera sp. PC39]